MPKLYLITEKTQQKHQVENFIKKILQLFLPACRKVQEKIT